MYNEFLKELNELCKKHKVLVLSSETVMPTGLEVRGDEGTIGIAMEDTFKPDGRSEYIEMYWYDSETSYGGIDFLKD